VGEDEVSGDIKGRDGLGRTGNPVQGSSDGLDVLSTPSVLHGLEFLDKVWTGWACAVEIHEDQRWNGGLRVGMGLVSRVITVL
jgi:hypothetical protein